MHCHLTRVTHTNTDLYWPLGHFPSCLSLLSPPAAWSPRLGEGALRGISLTLYQQLWLKSFPRANDLVFEFMLTLHEHFVFSFGGVVRRCMREPGRHVWSRQQYCALWRITAYLISQRLSCCLDNLGIWGPLCSLIKLWWFRWFRNLYPSGLNWCSQLVTNRSLVTDRKCSLHGTACMSFLSEISHSSSVALLTKTSTFVIFYMFSFGPWPKYLIVCVLLALDFKYYLMLIFVLCLIFLFLILLCHCSILHVAYVPFNIPPSASPSSPCLCLTLCCSQRPPVSQAAKGTPLPSLQRVHDLQTQNPLLPEPKAWGKFCSGILSLSCALGACVVLHDLFCLWMNPLCFPITWNSKDLGFTVARKKNPNRRRREERRKQKGWKEEEKASQPAQRPFGLEHILERLFSTSL